MRQRSSIVDVTAGCSQRRHAAMFPAVPRKTVSCRGFRLRCNTAAAPHQSETAGSGGPQAPGATARMDETAAPTSAPRRRRFHGPAAPSSGVFTVSSQEPLCSHAMAATTNGSQGPRSTTAAEEQSSTRTPDRRSFRMNR